MKINKQDKLNIVAIAQGEVLLASMRMFAMKVCHEIESWTEEGPDTITGAAMAIQFADDVKKDPRASSDPFFLYMAAAYIDQLLNTYYEASFLNTVANKYSIIKAGQEAISAIGQDRVLH